ncbi:response regulator [Siminovitchia sp. FSL H7-0308]|uniref:CitB family two-component system response regulator MalR n=1 Tax=Siminovitchia thermophila TaxID=1245522 RepID=A0ABS2RD48_9BACI|nr:response regulator [Siminovitchia thermophila]MBM7717581.1 CitB family two-component system response regulator MalR [Siminovitchia thermophila]ONK22354.1 hypothetical protein BLX87_16615 [Bacillus sp. VT-16-64]
MIRVLIVDDDPMVAKINKRYLEAVPGFVCAGIAEGVDSAIDMLNSTEIHLVLLDVYMPGKRGLELLKRMRNEQKDIDVIIISAASNIETIQSALHFGVVDYLIKPFEFGRFRDSLKKYKKKFELLHGHEKFSQEELDKLLKGNGQTPRLEDIPKGLTKTTLRKIVKTILRNKDATFSIEGLANEIGISRVSMGKYLNFLTEIKFLDVEADYETKGRPARKYRLSKQNTEAIYVYIEAADL